ncbi:DUF2931 family protein [Pseudomonas sp. B21-015]|uniref:DUF2931 family protein n=1 Tax=Pseudomonas sp. B21-015 TaxID=2895473 RepID=UPI00215F0B31|nr:DUF2931 family protein [Pseudomonas sp. B21-015]UVM47794.1 DUF2931 family protein [Pseudomonas sp. B21-015]
MSNFLRIAVVALLLGGCSLVDSRSLPYDAWRLGFSAPNYMEVWIETADVVDVQGQVYRRAMSGNSAIQTPPNNSGDPKGWPERPGWGKGKYVTGADLPKKIYVRWQSLVEPQTYQVAIDIPESTRELMRKKEKVFCAFDGKWITDYREALVVGLAPGGIAKVWVLGPCLPPIEVTRVKAEIDPRGPYEGQSGGEYDTLSDISKAYVKKFGVPYGSW